MYKGIDFARYQGWLHFYSHLSIEVSKNVRNLKIKTNVRLSFSKLFSQKFAESIVDLLCLFLPSYYCSGFGFDSTGQMRNFITSVHWVHLHHAASWRRKTTQTRNWTAAIMYMVDKLWGDVIVCPS